MWNYYIFIKKYSTFITIISIITILITIIIVNNNIFIEIDIPLLNIITINISINLILDWISCLFLRTVIFISRIILLFRIYYIPNKEQNRFSLILLLFITSIIILILSNNILLILLGWDGLGLSSYILVVYYQNYQTAASGSITLITNRIGDILILLSIGLIIITNNWKFSINEEYSIITILLLLIAACSKRAQFPFSAWLPIAIAAPTPISALVHSSTLVTAGVYIIIRINNNIHPLTILILIIISSSTAIYSRLSANWEQDLKKIIALSTLSQIAIIIFAISINSRNIAYLHLIIHALFKSTMFLCAGIIIHESSYQDIRIIGLNIYIIPLTSSIIGITRLSLIGIPFISGFFSKDTIIEKLISSKTESFITLLIIISIGITISYSLRISIISNKLIIKSKSSSTNHYTNYHNIPIIIISLCTIFSGTIIIWTTSVDLTFIFPTQFKNIIIITIILRILICTIISFKTKLFLKIGIRAISIWFNHNTSTNTIYPSIPIIINFIKNDHSWREIYGPTKTFYINKILSNFTLFIKISYITTLIIIIIIILFIILYIFSSLSRAIYWR